MDTAVVGLAAAIEALRAELTEAINRGWGQGMQFQVEPVELTVQAVVTKDANGKIGWKIFEVGGSYESAATQTLSLRLAPVWKRADGTLVKDFTIAAAGPAGDSFGPHEDVASP
ncbi:MAG: trypco2 family protein [Frankiaceae bacterium]